MSPRRAPALSPDERALLELLPAPVREHPLLDERAWVALRDSGIAPIDGTELITTFRTRAEFLCGAWLTDRAVRGGLLANLKPQMLRVADTLAARRFLAAVIMPRRSSKTTSLWCVLLGRCFVGDLLEEVYMAGFALATTQKKTAERYRIDVYGPIVRQWPDPDERPVKLYKGNGTERVEFTNGSLLSILSPDGEAFRSGAYDTLLLDEGGEASIELGEDIVAAVLPTFDTRPDGQFIVAGTAAKYRDGNVLHDLLADPEAARLRYTIADTTDPEILEAWEPTDAAPLGGARALTLAMHPGVDSGLTSLEKMEVNYRKLGPARYALEYLGLFGTDGAAVTLIPPAQWDAAGVAEEMPARLPAGFALAVAVHPDRLTASVAVAWKVGDVIYGGLGHHQVTVRGFSTKLLALARKHKVAVLYDAGSTSTSVEVEPLARASTNRPKLQPMVTGDVRRAATKLLKRLEDGTLCHYRQAQLDDAAAVAVKRAIGNAGGFGFGRPKNNPDADITGLEALALAVHALDDERPVGRPRIEFVA